MSTLSGHVEDESGKPLSDAAVTMVGGRDSTVTADDGRFVLHVASGAYILAVRRLGFRAERFAVSMAPGEQREVTIVESRAVFVLPTVTTTARERAGYGAVGFDQRMKMGIGQFLTYEQIQRRHATRLAQLLDQMRGIYVSVKDPKSFDYSVQGTHGIASCVGYVVDGVPQTQIPPTVAHRADGADFLLDPSAVGAIEVYNAAERPAQFGPGLMERAPPVTGGGSPGVDVDAQQWTEAHVAASSLSPSADTSALAIVERAAAAHAFPHLPVMAGGKGDVHLFLVTASIQPTMGVRAAVLGELEVPSWRLTRPARLAAPADQPDSTVPRARDQGDSVTLEAVVNEAGRVIPSTVRLIGGVPGDASARLIDRALRMRFEPALIGRCPVPELLLQPLTTMDQ